MPFYRIFSTILLAGVLIALTAEGTQAQESNFVISGYGSADYAGRFDDSYGHDFTASVSPVFLYQMGNSLLFEAELEYELSGGSTNTVLEYAQVNYQGFERVQITAGKFLLPFGLFGQRYHPTWINKLPTMSLLFGHAHGGIAEGALLPVLSDAGLMIQGKQPLSGKWSLDGVVWASQGPVPVAEEGDQTDGGDDGHAHLEAQRSRAETKARSTTKIRISKSPVAAEQEGGHTTSGEVPDVGFGVAFPDNNQNKMLGTRLGVVYGSAFEIYGSAFHAMYDEAGYLDLTGYNVAFAARPSSFRLRGEAILLRQEIEPSAGVFETVSRKGYYLQLSRQIRSWEPVVRWSELPDIQLGGRSVHDGKGRLAVGVNYWVSPSVPLKLSYSVNLDGHDAIYLQWAVGF